MMDLEYRLDAVLKEETEEANAQDLALLAKEVLAQIQDLETKLQGARTQLVHIIERLNGELGTEIRKRQNKIGVSHRDGSCTCGYRSRDLVCRPDLQAGKWSIGGRMGRSFLRHHPEVVHLHGDVGPLADAIVGFFKRYYRTLA